MACDKNEEYAANFLFESAMEDDDYNTNAVVAQSLNQPPTQPPQQPPQQPPNGGNPGGNNNNGD